MNVGNSQRKKYQPQKPGRPSTLSRKILTPIVIIFSLAFLGFAIFNYVTSSAETRAQEIEDSRLAEEFFQSKVQSTIDFANGLAILTATNTEVQALFAAQDRQALADLTYDAFLALEDEYLIRQFQFNLPPATTFLRLHNLDSFGDDLSSFRFTILEVNTLQHPVGGLEVGRNGVGIRGVQPVSYEERFIGSVEFGLNFDEAFVASLKEDFGYDWRILLTRESLSLATPEYISLLKEGPTPETLVLASTIEGVYPDPEIYTRAVENEKIISRVVDKERIYTVTSIPLLDYSGKTIGVVDAIIDRTEIVQAQNSRLALLVLGISIVMVLGAYILTIVTNRALRPLNALTRAAESIERGNLDQHVQISGLDEVGQLGNAFNQMASQLRDLVGTLEQRVNLRTQELTLAAEVGQSISLVQDLDALLSSAVELIRERFNLYYVQIYLAESTRQTLILRSGSGSAGAELQRRSHRLPIGTGSINGRAAAERRAIVVSDTASSTIFRANPLLSETRSEIVMPLLYADQVIGVIDLQSSVPNSLNTELLPSLEVLAGQLAIAITNARLYERTRLAQSELEAQTRSLTHQGWQEFLDAVERSEHIGYAYDQGILREVKERTLLEQGDGKLGVPIMVGAESIGTIQLERDADFDWSESDEELVHTVADRVAQQMETLRVLAQAEGYRADAEAATRRLTREGWEQFRGTTQLSEVYYNSSEVVPLKDADVDIDQVAFTHALSSHNQKIGELKILGIKELEPTDVDLISKVAERLAIHLENLRLNEQTQMALTTTSALYEGSERIINASSMDKILQALIQSSMLSKMTRSHIYFFDQPWEISMPNFMTSVATWASEGESPEPIGTSYPLSDYPFLHGMSRSEPFISLDLFHDPRVDLNTRKVLDELGLKSMVVFPMLAGGQWVGAIFGEATSKIDLPKEEIQQIEALVGQAGTVAQNLRLIEQTRTVALRERNLRQITAVVRNATSPDAILRTAARELGSAIGRKVVIQLGLQQGNAIIDDSLEQPVNGDQSAVAG